MKITIIGTGNVGSALARSFGRVGHRVTLAARDADKTRKVAADTGATPAETLVEAVSDADVVVVAVPFSAAEAVAREIAPAVRGKVVIDVSNALNDTYDGLAFEGGPSAAERVAAWLPDARVAKAFNTIFASNQADPDAHGQRIDALFAIDDDEGRAVVAQLLDSAGFRPVDAGPLVRARELESLGWLNMAIQMRHRGDWRAAVTFVGLPARAIAVPASASV
jgi:predicted dinucleotide-binding enzyme